MINSLSFKVNQVSKPKEINYSGLVTLKFTSPKRDCFVKSSSTKEVSFGSAIFDRIKELENKDSLTKEEKKEFIALIKRNSELREEIVDKATKETNKLGISKVDYSLLDDVAELFTTSLQDIKRAGIDLKGLQEIQPYYGDQSQWGRFDIDSDGTTKLLYNQSFKWDKENLQRIVSKENYSGYLLENNPKSLVYHLVGHFLHFKTDLELFTEKYEDKFKKFILDDLEYFKKLDETEKIRIKDLIKNEVGEYSFRKERDFPAEVFTGLMNGKKFCKEIMKLYKEIGMPIPVVK